MKRVVLTIAGAVDASGASIEVPRISVERVRRSLLRILKSNALCSMATVTPQGQAHINTAFFLNARSCAPLSVTCELDALP
jgi:hypothetical protein